jgi:signal transduction histidine kinase
VFGPVAEDARHHLSLPPGDPVTILGDRELLTQAFSNLIENAILHTPPGTIVTVSLVRENGVAVATVSDDGPGVPPDEHPKLFQRFYRLEASRTRPGFGLGLALVAAIAELHGASVTIDSRTGRGFAISLRFRGDAA